MTGRPMVFLVPDLADYTAGVRGFLFPFEDTAPGPLVAHHRRGGRPGARRPGVDGRPGPGASARSTRAFNPHQDGRAAERMLDAILTLL